MKKYPSVRVIFDRKKQSNRTTPGTVEVEILFNRERKRYSTKVRVLPSEWSNKDNVMVKGREDADLLNAKIRKMVDSFNRYIHQLIINDEEFTWEDFSRFMDIKGKCQGEYGNFISYIETCIQNETSLGTRTRDNHRKLTTSLKAFGVIRTFKDLTPSNIKAYDKWLHDKQYKQSTVASYHKFLKIYIHNALREELIEKNPYDGFQIELGKPAIRKYLTPEEIDKIKNANLSPSFEKIRDMFLFQVYTGLAYVDFKKFDFTKVIEKNGKYVIHDVRQKTGEEFYIVLLSNAIDILKRYNFKLPLMTLEQYNMRLKIVAGAASLNKNLTSHMARHTYACLALNHGVPIEVLKEMMGHADIRTTQVYAKMFNKTVENAYDMLEEKLNNRRENN